MSGIQNDHQKAESILHHILRIGSKVTNPIQKRRRKRFWKKRLKELQRQANPSDSSSVATSSTLLHASTTAHSSHCWYDEDDSCRPMPSREEQDQYLDDLLSLSTSEQSLSSGKQNDKDKVNTIDQNELLLECFMGNDGSCDNVAFGIHFFNEDSTISGAIDKFLETRLLHNSSWNWKCRRINARLSPLFAKILDIDPEQPTVVAIKDGIMVTKQTELTSLVVETQLERWLTATESMLSGEEESLDNFDLDDDYTSEEEEEYSSDEEFSSDEEDSSDEDQ